MTKELTDAEVEPIKERQLHAPEPSISHEPVKWRDFKRWLARGLTPEQWKLVQRNGILMTYKDAVDAEDKLRRHYKRALRNLFKEFLEEV